MTTETRSAVRSFQKQNRLPEDGIAGPETESALIEAKTGRTDTAEEPQEIYELFENVELESELEREVNRRSREYVRWLQRSLNRILPARLAVDGITGPMTRSVVRVFQKRAGIGVDGVVGPVTEAALRRAGAAAPPGTATPTSGGVPAAAASGPDIVTVRGIRVARQIAPQVATLLAHAERDGVRLGGWGYRSSARQIALRKKHCGTSHYDIYEKPSSQCTPPTAPPGRSMHERGLAIDFTYNGQSMSSQSNPGFRWLAQNAAKYGLYNYPREPWHWSVNGK